jgi:glycosyltransferase involved in cell wall biosynthesis
MGGAEILTAKLDDRMRSLGADVTIVFVQTPLPLSEHLLGSENPFRSLDLRRGRDVLLHPRRFAREVSRNGPDGALLIERGMMAAALRTGGYRGPIVAVEHGVLLQEAGSPWTLRRMVRALGRVAGAAATDVEVAVSDYMLSEMRRDVHARRTQRIYNGIDPDAYPEAGRPEDSAEDLVIGFAGRLVPGKGADHLLAAAQRALPRLPLTVVIAGHGPERARLVERARALGLEERVRFLGIVEDMPSFFERCDIVTVPSDAWVESFSMVTLEAMGSGRAIVASRQGAIPELILDGVTGTLVPPGDVGALAAALVRYGESPQLRGEHGGAARARAVERFHIDACAHAYMRLFEEVAGRRGVAPAPSRAA